MIDFSPNGKYLLLYLKIQRKLKIYRIKDGDIEMFFQKMKLNPSADPYVQFSRKDESFIDMIGFRRSKFCQQNRYLCVYSFMHLIVFDLEDFEAGEVDEKGKKRPKIVEHFQLNETSFKGIIDAQIQSLDKEAK